MRMRLSPALLTISFALAGAASADPAPIVYAGQGGAAVQTASIADDRLAGGADNSYGYGRDRSRTSATIDIRRPTSIQSMPAEAPTRVIDVQAPAGQGRPGWLEHERVGPPYEANGQWYVPTAEPGYEQVGQASCTARLFTARPAPMARPMTRKP